MLNEAKQAGESQRTQCAQSVKGNMDDSKYYPSPKLLITLLLLFLFAAASSMVKCHGLCDFSDSETKHVDDFEQQSEAFA